MVNKRRLHHWFVVLRQVKLWQLLLVLVLALGASAFFLRQNNLQMIELRNLVKKADEENKDIDKSLLALQNFVTSHMNTDLGDGIALQNSYERAYTAAVEAAANSTNPNAALYSQAELECRPVYQRTRSFPAYTQCAHDRLSQLSPGSDPLAALKTPPPEAFKYNFVSPLWSADLAGIAVALTGVVAFLTISKIITYLILRAILRSHR
ncbi:MAG TPA: hypothetical protein VFO38_04200 [Candidatus Saccharimonadales bacterium]|nr:hypothetical protein [Candidatus Saccharimonadales bacterium]